METVTLNVAKTISSQLGRQALFMMGAKNLMAITPKENEIGGLIFKISGSKNCNWIRVSLNGLDLYDVEFIKVWGSKRTVKHRAENVYCDMLHALIEEQTGLYLSL